MCSGNMKSVIVTIVALGLIGVLAYYLMQSDMMKKGAPVATETSEVATSMDIQDEYDLATMQDDSTFAQESSGNESEEPEAA